MKLKLIACSILAVAAMTDCEFTVKLFLENGADPTVRTNMPDWTEDHNLTALEIAKKTIRRGSC